MKTKRCLIALSILNFAFTTSIFAQEFEFSGIQPTFPSLEPNSAKKDGLSGKVKQIKDERSKAQEKLGTIIPGERDLYFEKKMRKYDDKGNRIETIFYDDTYNGVRKKWTYKYDDKENLTETIVYGPDGNLYERWTFKHDDNENITETMWYGQDGKYQKWICKYDNKGNKIEKIGYLGGELVDIKWEYYYTFNGKGNKIEETGYVIFSYSEALLVYKKNYDENGNKIEENHFKPDGGLFSKQSVKYDNKSNPVEINIYYSDDLEGTGITINKYDDKNNLIESREFNADGSLKKKETFRYDTDSHGNWIGKWNYVNGSLISVNVRDIIYY